MFHGGLYNSAFLVSCCIAALHGFTCLMGVCTIAICSYTCTMLCCCIAGLHVFDGHSQNCNLLLYLYHIALPPCMVLHV